MNREELAEIKNSQVTIISQDLTPEQKRDFIVELVKNWKNEKLETIDYESEEKEMKIA